MHLIGYISESCIPEDEIDQTLESIVSEAQLRNISDGITGILFFQQGRFIQLIEGYQSAVRDLSNRIANDPRHDNMHIFLDEQVLNRSCPEWSMVSINLDKKTSLDHILLEHIGDIQKRDMKVEASGFADTLRDFLAIPELSVELFG